MNHEVMQLRDECKRLAVAALNTAEATMPPFVGVTPGQQAMCAVLDAIDKLASMIPAGGLAEEARDAARYRWLRRHSYIHAVGSLNFGGGCWQTMPELLDEAIDALSAPTQTPPCRGTACGTTTGEHSAECVAEHLKGLFREGEKP